MNQPQTPFGFQTAQYNPNPEVTQTNKLLSTFMSQYVNPTFIRQITTALLFQTDFNTSQSSGKTSDAINIIKTFLQDSYKDVDRMKTLNLNYSANYIKSVLNLTRRVLDMKLDAGGRLLTYENLESHFPQADLHLKKFIQDIRDNPITNISSFRVEFDQIMQTIQLANELKGMSKTIIELDQLSELSENGQDSLLNLAINFRNTLINAYSEVSNLKVVSKVNDLSDFIMFSDKASVKVAADNITKFLSTGYSFFKSGYELIDGNLLGIESSNVHIICGPSNNCKSIFMINLMWQMILNNVQDFQENDLFVYYTLEDDSYKVLRRFISIFGNYDSAVVKNLFIKASSLIKAQNNKDIKDNNPLLEEINKTVTTLIEEAIFAVTGKRICFTIKHSHGLPTSASDVMKFMDARHCDGFKTKALFIDYIDCMVPSNSRYTDYNDYNSQGVITQELRGVSAEYGVPVITITQATRQTEDAVVMNNANMA